MVRREHPNYQPTEFFIGAEKWCFDYSDPEICSDPLGENPLYRGFANYWKKSDPQIKGMVHYFIHSREIDRTQFEIQKLIKNDLIKRKII